MEDRVSLYPGRVTLTPVEGQPNTYDMVRADQPTQQGTPLSKANLLKDTTAAQFGLGSEAVPDDVLSWIGKYNEYWWSLLHGEAYTAYEEQRTYRSIKSSPSEVLYITDYRWYDGASTMTIQYADDIVISQSDGTITLKDPVSATWSRTKSNSEKLSYAKTLLGKYILGALEISNATSGTSSSAKSLIFWIPTDAEISAPDDSYSISFLAFYSISAAVYTVPAGETTYEHSTDRNAYPDSGTVDGITYTYLGRPFAKLPGAVQIETGSYTGTGTYGSGNPNSLTFGFEPKLLFVYHTEQGVMPTSSGWGTNCFIWTKKQTVIYKYATSTNTTVSITAEGSTISWVAVKDANAQCNYSGRVYHYVAIG